MEEGRGPLVPREERVVFSLTAAQLDRMSGRELTDDELATIVKAIGFSTLSEALRDVVFAVSGSLADENEDGSGEE